MNRVKDIARRWIPAQVQLQRTGRSFIMGGEREVKELPHLVTPGTTVIDVGAHIGDYTYALCTLTQPKEVISFEPVPEYADRLATATRRLGLPVVVHAIALSSEAGSAELFIPLNHGRSLGALATLEHKGEDGRTIRVPLRRLDDMCRDVQGSISFIKIDVEGHELAVLKGAVQTIARHRPNLLIEIEARHSTVPIAATFAFIASLGYRAEYVDSEGTRHELGAMDVAEVQRASKPGNPDYLFNFIFRPNP